MFSRPCWRLQTAVVPLLQLLIPLPPPSLPLLLSPLPPRQIQTNRRHRHGIDIGIDIGGGGGGENTNNTKTAAALEAGGVCQGGLGCFFSPGSARDGLRPAWGVRGAESRNAQNHPTLQVRDYPVGGGRGGGRGVLRQPLVVFSPCEFGPHSSSIESAKNECVGVGGGEMGVIAGPVMYISTTRGPPTPTPPPPTPQAAPARD